jgi:hypothetical protein
MKKHMRTLMKRWFLLLAAVVMNAMQSGAQGSAARELETSDRLEIEKTFSAYNQALMDKKYDELARYLQTPFVVIDSTPRIITDVTTIVAGLRANRESLEQRGYATSVPAGAHISVLSPDRVLLNRVIRHYKRRARSWKNARTFI